MSQWWLLPRAQRKPATGGQLVVRNWQSNGFRDDAQSAQWREIARNWVEQYLAIPLMNQAPATHSGGVVNLDRGYGGGALRYFTQLSAVRLAAGAEYETMKERRRGFLNNNGVSGALKRDEDNEVSSTGLFVQGDWSFAERWAVHAGLRTTAVTFQSEDHFVITGNGDDSGSKTYRATTPVAGLLFKVTPTDYPRWLCYLGIHEHLDAFRHIAAGKATTMGHIQRRHLSGIIPGLSRRTHASSRRGCVRGRSGSCR